MVENIPKRAPGHYSFVDVPFRPKQMPRRVACRPIDGAAARISFSRYIVRFTSVIFSLHCYNRAVTLDSV